MSATSLTVSDEFEQSFSQAHSYPVKLLDKSTYAALLSTYRVRFEKASRRLFLQSEAGCEVAFRDLASGPLNPGDPVFERQNVRSLQQLRKRLGVIQQPPSARGPSIVQKWHFVKEDPKCRFVFLYGRHSRASLNLTKDAAEELFMYHQVMPSYLDFLFIFGQRSGPNDMKFSGFRPHTCLDRRSVPFNGLDGLGRSGQFYEMAFNLKTVQLKEPDNPGSWQIRPAAIYHSLDVVHGTTLWIITRGLMKDLDGTDNHNDLKTRIQQITGVGGRKEDQSFASPAESFRSSLAIHSMLVHWASEHWRWHLQWLDERIEEETEQAVDGTRDKLEDARKEYSQEDIQHVQLLIDTANESAVVIDGNIEVMNALCNNYEELVGNVHWPLNVSTVQAAQDFVKQIRNTIWDLQMQRSRAKTLANHAKERQNLILQYIQAQTAEHMEHLTKSTFFVGVSSQNEAISMRIITLVTLVFLPATFVSTFFSTDVIKYQTSGNQDGSLGSSKTSMGNFSPIAMTRWLQVTLPLTVLTCIAAWRIYVWEKRRQGRQRAETLTSLKLYSNPLSC